MSIYVMNNYEKWKEWSEPDDLEEAVFLMSRRTRAWKICKFKSNSGEDITQLIYNDPETGDCESMYIKETSPTEKEVLESGEM